MKHIRHKIIIGSITSILTSNAFATDSACKCQCFSNTSILSELVKGYPAAFVALIIGLIAAGIAYRQYLITKAKFKLDLFDRRETIYNTVLKFIVDILSPDISFGQVINFAVDVDNASFLFDGDVQSYIQEVKEKGAQLHGLYLKTKSPGGFVNLDAEQMNRHSELTEWFIVQQQGQIKTPFKKYLDFSSWK